MNSLTEHVQSRVVVCWVGKDRSKLLHTGHINYTAPDTWLYLDGGDILHGTGNVQGKDDEVSHCEVHVAVTRGVRTALTQVIHVKG